MGKKKEIIETLRVSINIANDAIEALKKINAINVSEKVKLKVENVGLNAQIDRQAEVMKSLQVKYDNLRDSKESLLDENSRLLHSIPHKKPRTYFEIASSERKFENGEIVHFFSVYCGWVFNVKVKIIENSAYTIKITNEKFKGSVNSFGLTLSTSEYRSLFTTAEMQEMGYEIPNVE